MQIELRQHQDGSYILEVRQGATRSEIDITKVVQEIFLDKLKELQSRIKAEEKYRNWVVESAVQSTSALATAFSRYTAMTERLIQMVSAIDVVVDEWRRKKPLKKSMEKLEALSAQSKHFIQNDNTLRVMDELQNTKIPQ